MTGGAADPPLAGPRLRVPVRQGAGEPDSVVLSADLLDVAPVGMALVDEETTEIAWCNRAFALMIGVPQPQCLGATWPALTGALAPQPSGDHGPQEQVWHPHGDQRTVSVRSVVPAETPGHVVHQVLDVTELRRTSEALNAAHAELRVRNAELERSNQDLTEFAYVASHDLSEPLRVVAGHVELLAEHYRDELDPDVERWIGFAVDGCSRMRMLIEDLLRYSRAGREIRRERVSVSDLFRDAIADAAVTIEARNADVRGPGDEAMVLGDRAQLSQVAANLVSNALKFVPPERRPVVEVTTTATPSGWRCEVSDNGPGIEERYRERVFRVFQRLHPREVPGTGIGLAICRRIVDEHGGRMDIADSSLGGATIAFELPAAEDTHEH